MIKDVVKNRSTKGRNIKKCDINFQTILKIKKKPKEKVEKKNSIRKNEKLLENNSELMKRSPKYYTDNVREVLNLY